MPHPLREGHAHRHRSEPEGSGGVFGGLLAHAGNDVAFVARGEHLAAIRAGGLRVHGPWGTHVVRPAVAEEPAGLAGGAPFDAVLVCVKAGQVREVAPRLGPLVGERTVVVPLQNGVEAAAMLAAELGPERVAGGLCHVFAWREGPGEVRTTGTPLQITLGELNGPPSPRLERLAEAIRGSGADGRPGRRGRRDLGEVPLHRPASGAWARSTRAPIGVTRSEPRTRALLVAAVEEVAAVARARGVALARRRGGADGGPLRRAAGQRPPPRCNGTSPRGGLPSFTSRPAPWSASGRRPARRVPVHRFLLAALLPQEAAARRGRSG